MFKDPAIRVRIAAAILMVAAFLLGAGHLDAEHRDDPAVTIFHADSLAGYMDELARGFETLHPGVAVRKEGTGSLDAIRRITDLHLPCDILVTADWRLLTLERPGIEPWVIVFAGNSMGLLYTQESRGAAEITPDNWYDVLLRPGVRYSHSNPERDPAGYWTLVVWQLAQRYYKKPGLAMRLAAGCPGANIRPKSVDLIALLQSGELDYYFGYASNARLGNLKFMALPPEIDLGDLNRGADYAKASIEIGAGANRRRIEGAPIAYGLTMTTDPPNRGAALDFIRMMIGPEGRKAAAEHGLAAYPQPYAIDPRSSMPAGLRALTAPLPR